MGWERRGNSRVYYRKAWRNGTCVSEYMGTGIYASFAAEQDEEQRQGAQEHRQALRRFQEELTAIDRPIDDLDKQVQDYVTASLLASGCHTHRRQWRRKRQ